MAETARRDAAPLAEPPPALDGWSENARVVLGRRYLQRDLDGRPVETPTDMLHRVARALAEPDARYGRAPAAAEARFFDRMRSRELLPNSPTLMNAGRPLGQLAACFVLPVSDSMEAIFDAVKWAAIIQMSGGGTGFSFSRLRPGGDRVSSTGGAASGPVPFIEVFNAATDAVRQGGTRRGANMGILRVDHPDVLEFAAIKADGQRLRNFNVSVALTDEFMRAVEADSDYALRNPRTGRGDRRLEARRVFRFIAQLAWGSGEPGVIFVDRVNAANPTPQLGEMEATNPCGELPLLPFEACNLASIDVSKFIDMERRGFDEARLGAAIDDGVHLLDNVVDANRYPLDRIEAITHGNRKIGLGVMGFADALVALGVPYDSDEALAVADRLMAFFSARGRDASAALADERGPFPNFDGSRWDRPGERKLRNATVTTIAPTGTISILAGCSGGIEPLYAISFVRRVLDGERLLDVNPSFVARARREGWYDERLLEAIARTGSVRKLDASWPVPDEVRRLYATAHDVSPSHHLRMQAAFQRHVDNAVSKTINCPRETTVDEVEAIYREAYRLGCKGVTVFRDGSRQSQVLAFGASAEDAAAPPGCPECGEATLVHQGGCAMCLKCGLAGCA
jgi:ribonucleoside-diphosphate reductase alpha chain